MATEAFKVLAKLVLDTSEFDSDLRTAEDDAGKFGKSAKQALDDAGSASEETGGKLGALKSVASTLGHGFVEVGTIAAKGLAIATGAAGAGVIALVKSAGSGYAEYEQLLGGVQKLYGNMGMSVSEYAAASGKSIAEVEGEWRTLEEAQNLVLKNANEAYKTAGMSANQYMETATGFSAALINSLEGNTLAAAEQTDIAMRSISDNVNTFGTDMNSVTNAYMGFAKQNYTMLDNLKLGYGGTKTEMERLIADANEYAQTMGMAGDLSIESFSDIVTAIDLVQQKQGIAGTTAREAAKTISGSFTATKAAWSNLLAGLANPDADLDKLFDDLITSAETTLENLLPVIERALKNIGEVIPKIVPIITELLPTLIEQIVPPLLTAAAELVAALIQALPQIIQALIDVLPTILQTLWDAIISVLQTYLPGVADFLTSVGDVISAAIPGLVAFFTGFAEEVGKVWEGMKSVASTAWDGIKTTVTGAWDTVKEKAGPVWENVKSTVTGAWEGIKTAVSPVVEAISKKISDEWDDSKSVTENVLNIMSGFISDTWEAIKTTISNALDAIWGFISSVWETIKSTVESVINSISSTISSVWNSISSTTSSIWNGISSTISTVINGISTTFSTIFEGIKTTLSDIWEGIKTTVSDAINSVSTTVTTVLDTIKGTFETVWNGIKDFLSPIIDWLKGIFNFEWNLPHIKLPHFSITGGFSLNPPSFPSFSINWYRKAMDQPTLLKGATVFGMMGGNLLGGGETGEEVVYGKQSLINDIRNAIQGYVDPIEVTINVYGAEGQDITLLAQAVQEEFVRWDDQRRAAYAS